MKKNNWIFYTGTMILLYILFYVFTWGIIELRQNIKATFDIRFMFASFIARISISVVFGIILGIEFFINERKQPGIWKIDYLKILIWGVPGIFISSYLLLFYNGLKLLPNILDHYLVIGDGSIIRDFSGVLFGYALITSFYKDKNDESSKIN